MTAHEIEAMRSAIAARACEEVSAAVLAALHASGLPLEACRSIAVDAAKRAHKAVLAAIWEGATSVERGRRRTPRKATP